MYIKTSKLEIDFTEEDIQTLSEIIFDAAEGMKLSITNHYNNLQDCYGRGVEDSKDVFLKQKGKQINLMQELLSRIYPLHRDLKKELLKFLEEDFKKQHPEIEKITK